MEIFAPYEYLVLIAFGLYVLITIITFILAYRLDKNGIRTKAKIIAIHAEEDDQNNGDSVQVTTVNYKADIEYRTKDNQLKQAKIPIAKRYLGKAYKTNLPIIYHQHKPEKPRINDTLYIYVIPIVLFTFLVIAVISFLVAISFI